MPLALVALTSVCISVAAQFVLKAGMSSESVKAMLATDGPSFLALLRVLFSPLVIAGFVLYGLGAVVWLKVLAQWDVSKAYPLVGVGFVLTAAVGYVIGEGLSAARLAGVLLIALGVMLVGRS